MYEHNIFEVAAIGSLFIAAVLLAAILLSCIIGGMWRWVDRSTSTKPTWVTQWVLDLWDCGDRQSNECIVATVVCIMIAPQLLVLLAVFWQGTLAISAIITLAHLARYSVDHNKVFKTHVADLNAHKETDDERS